MLHLISERRYKNSSAKLRKFTDVCMVGGTNLPSQKLKKRKLWDGLTPLLLIKTLSRNLQINRLWGNHYHINQPLPQGAFPWLWRRPPLKPGKSALGTRLHINGNGNGKKSNITLKSKSTTFHGNHALFYISSPSGFPFRKWSVAFFRHFLFLEVQSVSVKKKKDRIPGSNPDLQTRLVTQNSFFLLPSPSSGSRSRGLSSP